MIITSTIELSYLSYTTIITHLKQLFNTLKQEITTLVENSDQQETLTFQEEIIQKMEEITMQNQVNFIFMGVFIAFGCVSIFQKAFLKR